MRRAVRGRAPAERGGDARAHALPARPEGAAARLHRVQRGRGARKLHFVSDRVHRN